MYIGLKVIRVSRISKATLTALQARGFIVFIVSGN